MRSKRALRQLVRRELRRLSRRERLTLSRRELLKMGLVASGGALLPLGRVAADSDSDSDSVSEDGGQSPPVDAFQRDLPIPEVLNPVTSF